MHKIAGLLFFIAGATIVMGIITAEIFYPVEYSISQNMISNLGATRPPHSIIRQPSADIFDNAMLASGVMILLGSFLLYKTYPKNIVVFSMAFLGIGTFGVGIFPAFHVYAHPLVAFIAFFSGGISAVLSARVVTSPFKYVAFFVGIVSLTFLFFGIIFPQDIVPILGRGGTERWVAYPMMLWMTGFGGYLMSNGVLKKSKKGR